MRVEVGQIGGRLQPEAGRCNEEVHMESVVESRSDHWRSGTERSYAPTPKRTALRASSVVLAVGDDSISYCTDSLDGHLDSCRDDRDRRISDGDDCATLHGQCEQRQAEKNSNCLLRPARVGLVHMHGLRIASRPTEDGHVAERLPSRTTNFCSRRNSGVEPTRPYGRSRREAVVANDRSNAVLPTTKI